MSILDMISEDPIDLDIKNSLVHIEEDKIIVYDESRYLEEYEPKDILGLVQKRKIPGVVIEKEMLKSMLSLLFDSYLSLSSIHDEDSDRRRVANKIFTEILNPLELL